MFERLYCFEIWPASWQQLWLDACQVSEGSGKLESHICTILRDLNSVTSLMSELTACLMSHYGKTICLCFLGVAMETIHAPIQLSLVVMPKNSSYMEDFSIWILNAPPNLSVRNDILWRLVFIFFGGLYKILPRLCCWIVLPPLRNGLHIWRNVLHFPKCTDDAILFVTVAKPLNSVQRSPAV